MANTRNRSSSSSKWWRYLNPCYLLKRPKCLALFFLAFVLVSLLFWDRQTLLSEHEVELSSLKEEVSQLKSMAIECLLVILVYSRFRRNPEQCWYWKAVGRGILGIPAGALVNALGAIALGAPVGIQHFTKTVHWSIMMSSFTFVPAASVFGSSWMDWQRVYAQTKPVDTIDYMICLPAHGAVIGAWFGAWPMPLDWERPWQEWPISVSYGSIAGYLIGTIVCVIFLFTRKRRQHFKED